VSAEPKHEPSREELLPLDGIRDLEKPPRPAPEHVSLVAHGTFASDQYESLRHFVKWTSESRGHKVFAVSSAAPGDGKTLTSINLAGALAHGPGTRVLLVDADLRRPAVFAQLGLERAHYPKGLTQVAWGQARLRDVVRFCPEYRLHLLPGGAEAGAPYDVLGSPALASFLDEVRRYFHFVIVDAPPAVGFPDFRQIEKWADGTLLVVSEGRTPRGLLKLAFDVLDRKKSMGIVLNRADVKDVSRYYDAYYKKRPADAGPSPADGDPD
jgi:capsular exopolysaccharide synthesis family protein